MRIVVCSEKGRSFELQSPKNWQSEKIKIDGGLISGNETEKCDYAITVKNNLDNKYLFFIELKGHDLMKAISQLESTINQLITHFPDFPDRQAHAVCSRIIPNVTTTAQIAAVRFKKKHGFLLKWHSQKGIVSIKS
ncbi:hypothetical protein ACH50O_13815 [Methylomonas sp. 2BW1-5-20]|uniref:hypothetical protein n=1 Tax=Methylomonas sp. 2BW1-5-20 TaxID=3376686 RepID=UPI00404E3919